MRVSAFTAGLADGLDPQPAAGDDTLERDGEAITQATSGWIYRECRTCGHTFRRGDHVTLDRDTGQVRHLDPALDCAVPAPPEPAGRGTTAAAEFAHGLHKAFPPLHDVRVTRLGPDAVQLPDRSGDRRPMLCQGCGHTFRAGESVVVCLCHPHDPGRCVTAIHRDPGAGLPCWEITYPEGRVDVCPWRWVAV